MNRFATPSPRLIPEGEKPDTFAGLALATLSVKAGIVKAKPWTTPNCGKKLLEVARDRLALHPKLLAAFRVELDTKVRYHGALMELGDRLALQAALARATGDRSHDADPTPQLVAMVDAWAKPRLTTSKAVQPLMGGLQKAAPAGDGKESAEARRARVLEAFHTRGLTLPASTYANLPRGIGRLAQTLGMTRQQVARDLNKIREQREASKKSGAPRRSASG